MVQRILVATDFSEDADRALTVAIDFGNRLKATVDLVHVITLKPLLEEMLRPRSFSRRGTSAPTWS